MFFSTRSNLSPLMRIKTKKRHNPYNFERVLFDGLFNKIQSFIAYENQNKKETQSIQLERVLFDGLSNKTQSFIAYENQNKKETQSIQLESLIFSSNL